MILTPKQEAALKLCIERYKNHERYTVIAGYAGTGKSTTVKYIIEALSEEGIDPAHDVAYVAPTGRAAVELMRKGNSDAKTIHKLLYRWIPLLRTGGYMRQRIPRLGCKIVVVDETSMIAKNLIEELLTHTECYMIFLGDNYQLPTLFPEDDNHLLDKPHIFLDQVMRQAQESEIIRLTMDIRANKTINPKDYHEQVRVLPRNQFEDGMLLWADQVVCATNKTRNAMNEMMRQLLGRGNNPGVGDKIISLHNEWDILDDEQNPLINGTIGYIDRIASIKSMKVPYWWGGGYIDRIDASFTTDMGTHFNSMYMDKKMILTGEKCITNPKFLADIRRRGSKYNVHIPHEFTYGYCITIWKAQGGEFDKVLYLEEGHPHDKVEHQRANYTACTRAKEKLIWVQK